MTPRTSWQYGHWIALDDDTYDGPGSPMGFGNTEQAAIEDLKVTIAERELDRAERRAPTTQATLATTTTATIARI